MSTNEVLRRLLGNPVPKVAVLLGSSLGGVSAYVEDAQRIPYSELAGFPVPKISGHSGELVIGSMGGRRVLFLQGRAHPYESGNPAVMRPVIAALAKAGIEALLLTNAAGSVDVRIQPASLMLIADHINFAGMNPLIGEKGDDGFIPMTRAYDEVLANSLRAAAKAEAINLAEGVYMWLSGPSFETPAEIRMARILGADAVGMSTVPEVLLARRFKLRVAAISAITNLGAGMSDSSPSHDETKRIGARSVGDLARLLKRFFAELDM